MKGTENKAMGKEHVHNGERWLKPLRIIGWSLVGIILLLPAIGMQFSDEVDWSAGDLIFAAVILVGTGLTVELTVRRSSNNAYRAGVVVALAAAFLMTWSNAAVGFVGSGPNPANILYFILPLIVIVGCSAAGFQPKGMAVTMVAAAIIQALITAFAFASDLVEGAERFAMFALNGFFIALWIASAALFRKAAKPDEA
jgi:hypothetical protein